VSSNLRSFVRSTAGPTLGLAALGGLLGAVLVAAPRSSGAAERAITVEEAVQLARDNAPALALARADEERAQAATLTARQYGNPSLSALGGYLDGRRPGVEEGGVVQVAFQQPLESPWVRGARRREAGAALASARAGTDAVEAEVVARVKSAFSDVLRAQDLRGLAGEQLELLSRVRAAIERTVAVGEGPGLDLARAETEVLNARRDVAQTRVAVTEARLELAAAVGEVGGGGLAAQGGLPGFELPQREELRGSLLERNPRIAEARREVERAQGRLDLERHKRFDGFDVVAGWDREPDNQIFAVGLRVPLPVWNLRRGQIGEATARVKRARAQLAARELALGRQLDALYNRYEVSREQVQIIEEGLLAEADRALRGAEVAYRSGERGILEYLDAQRTLRDIRLDLVRARGEMQRAGIEIERLAGTTR
jgi:cobalt-zinc-cadmium efflux system outer membrane protein